MLRLATWNCRSAFELKWQIVKALKADVVVVQEVRYSSLTSILSEMDGPDFFWSGGKGKKGVAVIAFNNWKLSRGPKKVGRQKYFLPVRARKGRRQFDIIGVWAMADPKSHQNSYIGQVHDFVSSNSDIFRHKTIMLGDFNANAIWDGKREVKNFSNVARSLSQLGQTSAYHHHYEQKFGKESRPTFHLYGHKNRPYHIDYCFLGKYWLKKLIRVRVLPFNESKRNSDHLPMLVDLSDKF